MRVIGHRLIKDYGNGIIMSILYAMMRNIGEYQNTFQTTPQIGNKTNCIKKGRTLEDLLFQVMLDLGVLLSSKITENVMTDKKVFNVAQGFLIVCFDDNVTVETVKAIAQQNLTTPSSAIAAMQAIAWRLTLSRFSQRILPIQ
jgi:hypothetical protein